MQDIEKKLESILVNVNDWLKFAETKNAGILVFAGAAIATMMSFLGSSYDIQHEWKIGLFTGITFLSVACLLAVWSFIPRTKIVFRSFGKPSDTDNLQFYGHLCKYNPCLLVEKISKEYYENDLNLVSKNYRDIATQIVVNSGIAMDKYIIFKIAAWVLFIGLLSVVIVPAVIILYTGG